MLIADSLWVMGNRLLPGDNRLFFPVFAFFALALFIILLYPWRMAFFCRYRCLLLDLRARRPQLLWLVGYNNIVRVFVLGRFQLLEGRHAKSPLPVHGELMVIILMCFCP